MSQSSAVRSMSAADAITAQLEARDAKNSKQLFSYDELIAHSPVIDTNVLTLLPNGWTPFSNVSQLLANWKSWNGYSFNFPSFQTKNFQNKLSLREVQ